MFANVLVCLARTIADEALARTSASTSAQVLASTLGQTLTLAKALATVSRPCALARALGLLLVSAWTSALVNDYLTRPFLDGLVRSIFGFSRALCRHLWAHENPRFESIDSIQRFSMQLEP